MMDLLSLSVPVLLASIFATFLPPLARGHAPRVGGAWRSYGCVVARSAAMSVRGGHRA